jgi:heptosyltransferase-3
VPQSVERSQYPRSGPPGRIQFAKAYSVAALYALVNSLIRAFRVLLWPRRKPSDPQRICIWRVGFIGDTVVALPAIHAIRVAYPRAQLTLLTSPVEGKFPGARELFENSQLFDEVYVYLKSEVTGYRNRVAFLRTMRSRRFDIFIDLPQELAGPFKHLRNLLIARLMGVRWGYGWGFVTTIKLWVQAQSECLKFENEVEKLLAVVRSAGIPVGAEAIFPIELGPHERNSVDRLLGNLKTGLIGIAPGAKMTLNHWPAERFATVGRYLVARGFTVVVLGGTADASICRAVVEGIGNGVVNLAGRTSLKESCETLRRCAMLICNDSGVQHLSSAVGTPCISIFSSHQIPGKWYPYGSENVVLRKWVECHTCYLQTCPNDNRCLKLTEADEVIAAIEVKLESMAETDPVRPRSYALSK